ncbi:stage II sporulation protein P [Bacillaceae bacterium W0354]
MTNRTIKLQKRIQQFKSHPIILFQILFIILILLVPIFSKPIHEASTNLLQDWVKHIDGASFSFFLTVDQPVFEGLMDNQEEKLTMSSFVLPLLTNLPYKDIRLLFGHELPKFPLSNSTIAVAGKGTNIFTTTIESAPPDYLLEDSEDEPVEEEKPPVVVGDESIFIYTTHNREGFLPYLPKDTPTDAAFHREENVMKLSRHLQANLEDIGLNAYVDQTDYWQQIVQNEGVEYYHSYNLSRSVVEKVMANNSQIKYLIDIHRDSQPRSVTTTKLKGESVAKLMFVLGGDHENYKKNLQFANELHQLLEENYPGVSRGVEVKSGKNTNGIFNQDLSDRSIVVEVGGVDNNYEELYKAIEILADVFSTYYFEQEGAKKQ